MQDTNVLLTQTKTTLFNEVIKVKPQGNISKSDNVQGHAFVDLLFSDHVEAVNNNAIEIGFNDQRRHDSPIKNNENSVATADPDNESKAETIQGNSDLNSYKDISRKESVTNSKDENISDTVDVQGKEDLDIKSDIISKHEFDFSAVEDKGGKDVKADIISKLKAVFSGIEETEGKGEKADIITKLDGVFAAIEDKEGKDVKADIISKLKAVFSGIEETKGKGEKADIITKLERVFAAIEDKGGKDVKADIISKLKAVFSGIEETKGKGVKTDITTKLERVFAAIDNKEVKAVMSDVVSKLKVVFSGMEETEGKGVKTDIITKLDGVFAVIDDKEVKAVMSDVISKLKAVFSGIEEKEGKAVRADIVKKRKGLFSKDEGVRNKNEDISVFQEKNIDDANNYEKNKGIVKSGEANTDKNLLKGIVERLDENKNEKIINKEKNIEKRHIVNDTASRDLNGAKVSGKTKESTDGSYKSAGDSLITLENETGAESRVTKDGNRIDISNTDRDIRAEQRVVSAQGTKSDLTDQRQNKNRFAHQMKNGKMDNGNLQRTDADQQIVMGKTQTVFRSETAGQVNKTPVPARTISQSQLGETIVRSAKQFQKGGNSEIHLTIKKPELGNVKLSFVENGKGRLEVTLVAERHETAELIKQNSAEMRQLLQQEGIDLSRFDVLDQDDRNKKHFAQWSSFNNGSRKNHSVEDGELDKAEETVVENHELSVSDVGNVDSDEQVNVFV